MARRYPSSMDPPCYVVPIVPASRASLPRCVPAPDYHARPVLPFGDPKARLLVVGLAPGMHGANRTGRPFTGDYAGILLYETLHAFGFGSQPVSVAADDACN
jgi:uracil-DNA glycosylase